MKSLAALVSVLLTIAACSAEQLAEPDGEVMVAAISYTYVGGRGETDAAGNKLEWIADATGGVTGTLYWWFDPAPADASSYIGGELTFYTAHWQLRDGDRILLAGRSAGKTDVRTDSDGVWDGHGIVTATAPEYAAFLGGRIYETGTVLFGDNPPDTFSGAGMFAVTSNY